MNYFSKKPKSFDLGSYIFQTLDFNILKIIAS